MKLEELRPTTATAQRAVSLYRFACHRYLWEVYDSYSDAKARAYEEVRAFMYAKEGEGLYILTFNKFSFTCAFKFTEEGKRYLAYFTPSHSWRIALD